MTKTVDYYYSLVSPWTYFGWPRLAGMPRPAGAAVNGHLLLVDGGWTAI